MFARRTDCELVIVLGGDGTSCARRRWSGAAAPLLGVNLGHVGFLAESERDDLAADRRRVARPRLRRGRAHDPLRAGQGRRPRWSTRPGRSTRPSLEKASRERLLEVVLEVDGRPLSSFGCDGVVMSTPTGSTAYSFSAGGPVVWPSVDALLLVPLSAHALFARPLVVGPESRARRRGARPDRGHRRALVRWPSHRDLPRGARVDRPPLAVPVRLARLNPRPFTDRLVNKFPCPVDRMARPRASDEEPAAVIEEISIRDLGVIARARLRSAPASPR